MHGWLGFALVRVCVSSGRFVAVRCARMRERVRVCERARERRRERHRENDRERQREAKRLSQWLQVRGGDARLQRDVQ